MIPEVAKGRIYGTFGNFGGDCPVQENGRKGHTFYYEYREIIPLRQYADAVADCFVSVRPETVVRMWTRGFGFHFKLVRNARHGVNLFILRRV